jgi:hypothetical protein
MTSKRLISGMLVAVICAGVAISSFAQEVYSPNVVGFNKVSVKDSTKPYTMASTPFFSSTNPTIDNVMGYLWLTGSNTYNKSDNIMVYDPIIQRYKEYFLYGKVGDPLLTNRWIDKATDEPTTNIIVPGMGFWIRSRQISTQTVVFSGEVPDEPSATIHIYPGYQMIAYPYSASIKLTNTSFLSCGAYASNTYNKSDNIMIWNAESQRYSEYYIHDNSGADPLVKNKWIDKATDEAATSSLEVGTAFWYRHRGTGFNWVESIPYTLSH